MPKNIIVLSDGTGNGSAKLFKTNVWRTYEALDLSDPAKQIAYYDDGVGTSPLRPIALVTGAIGIGLSRNVRELYAFLCRNYQPGDRIYGFGFSRGAFTIRILAGFVAKLGLLKGNAFSGERDLWKKTTWLYRVYRKQCGNSIPPLLALIIRALRDALPGQAMDAASYENSLDQTVKIEFLGLWDTVDAYGLPIDEMTTGWDNYVWPLSMRNYDLSDKVKRAVHALSLDDERNSFHPLLWNETSDEGDTATINPIRQQANATNIENETLTQVWFAGMHADVGGGYADDSLSYIPLNFVLSSLGKDVLFNKVKRKEFAAAARMTGVVHDSRKGVQSYYRLLPRKLEKLLHTSRNRVGWISERRKFEIIKANVVEIKRPKIHHSVFDRIKATAYTPIVLPAYYAEVAPTGAINNVGTNTFEISNNAAGERAMAQERVWDLVWWRRITYFATLFVTICLALLPWMQSLPMLNWIWPLTRMEEGTKCIQSALCFLGGIPKLFGVFLPSFASNWIETFSANPGVFGALAFAIAGLMWLGKRLDNEIRDRMSGIWHPSAALDTTYSGLRNFRESKPYQWTLRRLKKDLLPLIFGLGTLLIILTAAVSGTSRIAFSWSDAAGTYCIRSDRIDPVQMSYSGKLELDPKKPCGATGLRAEKGATYRVVINIKGKEAQWQDGRGIQPDGSGEVALKADLRGNLESHRFLKRIFAWPTKRYLWENYYKPVARIRGPAADFAGQDEYVLNPTFASSRERYDCLISDFTAQSSGELFLFVNDAIIYFVPNGLIGTYENNSGTAEVFVKRIANIGEPFSLPPGMGDRSACQEFVSGQP
jgi:uncharacterized protein (DUF2235 family)